MQEPSELGRIVQLVRDLRKRCPWDGAQTPETLRPYLVEEVLELDQALADGNPAEIMAELGDVLLHVAFQIVLGEETGSFGAEDLVHAVERKMWRRHPHLYEQEGQEKPTEALSADVDREQVAARWEQLKADERRAEHRGLLHGLPRTLPALITALRLQERAAGVGFDWPDSQGPMDKVREELGELERERADGREERVTEEVGDLLFAVINLARKLGCDPRAALEKANDRFIERFGSVETLAAERDIDIATAGLQVLDSLWEEAKKGRKDGKTE